MEQHLGLFWNMIRAVLGACHLNWWHTSVNEYMVILDVRNWITNFPGVYIDMIHSKTFIAIVEVTSFLSSAEALCCRYSVQFTYRAESLMVQWLRFLKWNSSSYICRNENKYFDAQAFVLTAKATTGSKSCTVNTRPLHYFLPRHFFSKIKKSQRNLLSNLLFRSIIICWKRRGYWTNTER